MTNYLDPNDARNGTIKQVLARPNPGLRLTATSRSLSTRDWWEKIEIKNVSEWRDFSYDNLMNGWGHLIENNSLVRGTLAEEISDTQLSISDEDKVDNIALQWTINNIKGALKEGAKALRPNSKHEISIGKHVFKFRTQDGNHARPDMGIFWHAHPGSGMPKTCLVVGDNKTSRGWSAANILKRTGAKNYDKDMRPINQITTYCMLGNTRYGWIMTDREVVVCRVSSKTPNGPAPKNWKVELKSVPWEVDGPGVLTVNLSLWWLGMMGTSRDYREIQEPMMPINLWWEEKIGQQTTGYTHHLSGLQRPASDPPLAGSPRHPRQPRVMGTQAPAAASPSTSTKPRPAVQQSARTAAARPDGSSLQPADLFNRSTYPQQV